MQLEQIRQTTDSIAAEVRKAVVGQDEALRLLLIGLLTDGHVLLEGVPGTAKTLLARSFAAALHLIFRRLQFTPDLMPGDVIGTNLFNFQTNSFALTKGPIFTQLLLADEINRTPPKTQAALLEAMQERTVTIDGTTYPLERGFMVIATQNPIENQGTYPLPEAQLDRFLFKHVLDYPDRAQEVEIVSRHGHRSAMPQLDALGLAAVASLDDIDAMRAMIQDIRLSDDQVGYVVDVIRATREHPALSFGASPRSASALATAARAAAVLDGRDFVIPDDIKGLAVPVLRHRVVLAPVAEIEGRTAAKIVREIVDTIAAPR